MSTEPNTNSPREGVVESFERRIVFTGARWVYLLLAGLAVAVVALSLTAGAYGVLPVLDFGAPSQPDPVEPREVDEEMVKRVLQELFDIPDAPAEDVDHDAYADGEPMHAPLPGEEYDDNGLGDAVDALARHFDEPTKHPWTDGRVCASRGYYGRCYRRRTVRGARSVLMEGLMLAPSDKQLKLVSVAERFILAAPDDDDGRFVYTGLFKDMMLATGGHPSPVITALENVIKDSSKWTDEAKLALGVGLIKAKTGGKGTKAVIGLVEQAPRMLAIFQVSGLQDTLIEAQAIALELEAIGYNQEQVAAVWTIALNVAEASPPYQRDKVFDAWKMAKDRAYDEATAENTRLEEEWLMAVADYEQGKVDAAANRTAARGAAVSGFSSGMLGVCILGILLAILAVERNTRRTQALITTLTTQRVDGASSVAPPSTEGPAAGEAAGPPDDLVLPAADASESS